MGLLAGLGLLEGRCPGCQDTLEGAFLCERCAQALAFRSRGYCTVCGVLFDHPEAEPVRCSTCRSKPPPWNRVVFHGEYRDRMQELVWAFKYHGHFGAARILGRLSLEAALARGIEQPEVIVPVPLHWRRLIRRGFNQSVELARPLARHFGMRVNTGALARTRYTRSQASLTRSQRRANIAGAFRADPAEVKGRSVLLVDDVMTTGSTMEECGRVLAAAGAQRVDVLVAARTGPGR